MHRLLTCAVCLLSCAHISAQTFRARVETVLVTVTVHDADNRIITGLSREQFEIFEDGVPQAVTQFTNERAPISLGILLDASDSMRGQPIIDARAAVDRFVADLRRPGDTEVVNGAGELAAATERIANELNYQYMLGYVSTRPADGSWRAIRVRMRNAAHFTRARRGYYAIR